MSKTSSVSFTLRSTGRTSAMYQDRQDFTVCEDGRAIGRIREDPRARAQLRWFWMITVPGDLNWADIDNACLLYCPPPANVRTCQMA